MIDTNKYISLVTKYRRDLHKIPEIGFDLFLTHEYIINELKKLELEFEVVAKTGIIVYLRGIKEEAIAFRADMDALNVEEATGVNFKSIHKGKMHACGHDGHMAILLGFLNYLKENKEKLKKSIVLIFQPAEEGPGGALEIIKTGIFERYKIEKIYGLHLDPSLPEGIIGIRSGEMLAQNAEFNIEVIGKSSHGAIPQLGSDAIVASSNLVMSYQTIISRNINPLNPALITIGTISGGDARNIIANSVRLTGTIRALLEEDYQYIKSRITEINQGIEKLYNVSIKEEIIDYYKSVVNDHYLYLKTINYFNNDEYKIIEPMLISEDFSFYQRVTKGLFVMLGTKNESKNYIYPLHSNKFNFDEKVLIKGIKYFIAQLKINNCLK